MTFRRMAAVFLLVSIAAIVGMASYVGTPGNGTPPFLTTAFDFAPQSPGGTLTSGTPATVTLTPCPLGVNGTDSFHNLWVSGGTGTAEGVTITGGTCTAGQGGGGTITFTPANNHSGGWTIKSVANGLPEAISAACSAGGAEVIIPANTVITSLYFTNIRCSNVYVHGSGKSSQIHLSGTTAFNGISVLGQGGSTSLLGATGNEGDAGVTLVSGGVASLGIAVNDAILIRVAALTLQQVCKVTAVSGDVITCSETLAETFTTGAGSFVQKFTRNIRRARISNLLVDGSGDTNSASNGVTATYWTDGEISDIWCTGTGGSCITTAAGHGNTFQRIKMSQCSNSTGQSDMYPFYETAAFFSDIESEQAGFGPTFPYLNHSVLVRIHSSSSAARGLKLLATSHNTFVAPRVFNAGNTFTGFDLQSSHNNIIYGIESHKNLGGAGDLVFGEGSSSNTVLGGNVDVLSFQSGPDSQNNVVHDVAAGSVTDITARTAGNSSGLIHTTLSWGCTGTATSSQTIWLYAWPPTACSQTANSFPNNIVIPGRAGVAGANAEGAAAQNFSCNANTGGINASSGVFTLMVNGSASNLTFTMGTAQTGFDTTHRYKVAPGDNLIPSFTTQAGETLAGIRCSVDIE